ncbi:MAG: DUF58 domain-containing protein [Gemmataceae bacterium]
MLTTRGWWFLLIVSFLLVVALLTPPFGHPALTLLTLTLFLWFAQEWLRFAWQTHALASKLSVCRELRDERGRVTALWAGQAVTVRVRCQWSGWLDVSWALLSDWQPLGSERFEGDAHGEGPLARRVGMTIEYRLHCPHVGRLRFEGVAAHVSDWQGFFYHRVFLRQPVVIRVLPPLVDTGGHAPSGKRHNLLPPPGVHRHRRPGSGSELLDLRDYLPGDPPKLIAWRASARRDRLITREYESEVPVRCTVFLDTSPSTRLGPAGRNALARLIEITAAVSQAAIGNRDLVGLCLFDDEDTTYLAPARTRQHLIRLLQVLTDAANQAPATGTVEVEEVLPLAYGVADELYPDMLDAERNHFPLWLPWVFPQTPATLRWPTWRDWFYRSPLWVLIAAAGLTAVVVPAVFLLVDSPRRGLWWLLLYFIMLTSVVVGWMLAMGAEFNGRRRGARWRKRLAALLSVRDGLAPGGLSLLLEDDERFVRHAQRFLAEHQVPYRLPLYDPQGRYQFAAPAKIDVLARALLRAVHKGHDNELFVLCADVLELSEQLGPLLRAVQLALARHHRVLVICPWPPGMPLPGAAVPPPARADSVALLLDRVVMERWHRAYQQSRRSFAALGVPVLCALEQEPVAVILKRMDDLRLLEKRR